MTIRLTTIRAGYAPVAAATAELRAASGKIYYSAEPTSDEGLLGRTLTTMFSRFDTWYEIDSWWEGNFVERIMPGAFRKTMTERGSQVKALFDHGMDFSIGDKPLGRPSLLAEEPEGARLDAPLLDTTYVRDLVPGLAAGAYGSSFMFEVLSESWVREPAASDYNPAALPERSVTEVRLYEAGPVTWPASPTASAGLLESNSLVDPYMEALAKRNRGRYDALSDQYAGFRAARSTDAGRAKAPTVIDLSAGHAEPAPDQASDRHFTGASAASRARALALIGLPRE